MMVDFSLTAKDEQFIELARREHEAGRRHARELDRTAEHETPHPRREHPDVAGTEDPWSLLERDPTGASSAAITAALMEFVSAKDADLRDDTPGFGGDLVAKFGTPEQKAKFGDLRLALGLTEPGAGSDLGNLSGSWRYDAATDEYVLNGEKVFISAINRYDGAVAMLRGMPDDRGRRPFASFVVLKSTPGFHESSQFHKMGIHRSDIGGFTLEDMRVPADHLLKADFSQTITRFNSNRPLLAARALGVCRSLLDFTKVKLLGEGVDVDYGVALQARTSVEDRLIHMEALWEAAWGCIMQSKWKETQHGASSSAYRTEAAIAKAMGGKAAREISQGCLELLGSEGLSEEYLAEKWFRDLRVVDIYEGTGEVLRLSVARELLGYDKSELK